MPTPLPLPKTGGWPWDWAMVTHVVDGDTFDAVLTKDVGLRMKATAEVRLRLGRINAPKKTTPEGTRAVALLVGLIADNQPVHIDTYKPYHYNPDDKAEWVAELW